MRKHAIILAALGLALALPVSAAHLAITATGAVTAPIKAPTAAPAVKTTTTTTIKTAPVVTAVVPLTAAVKTQAGILPTSPLSGIDKALDSLSMAVAVTPAAKTTAALKVAQENAAEAAVMSEKGNLALTTKAVTKVDTALTIATTAATKVTTPAAAAVVQKEVLSSTIATKATLQLGVNAAPPEVKPQILIAVTPTITKLEVMPATIDAVLIKVAPAIVAKCDPKLFTSCVQDNGCTKDTSQKCFNACPPKSVPCQKESAGKTCSVPDTACVNDCLQKISVCSDTCLTQSNCKKGEVSTSTLQIIAPETIQKGFQLQLKANTGTTIKK